MKTSFNPSLGAVTNGLPMTITTAPTRSVSLDLETDFFKALSEPVRQKIVMILLTQGRLNIQEISNQLVQDRSVVSRHLSTLQRAGFVKGYKFQRYTEYELDGPSVILRLERLLTQIRQAAAGCCPVRPGEEQDPPPC